MISSKKTILISLFILFLVSAILPQLVLAQETEAERAERCKDVKKPSDEIPLQMPIPIITGKCCTDVYASQGLYCVKDIGEYLVVFYKYFSGIVGILAATMIVYAGIQWIVAAGNSSGIEKAKATMNGAAIGLVLTLSAYLILNTINPELVSMRIPHLGTFDPVYIGSNFCADMPDIEGLYIPEKIPCGGEDSVYKLPNPPEGESGASYAQDFCCGSYCEPVSGKVYACAIAKGQTISAGEECPEQCIDMGEVCRDTHKNECPKTDALLASQNIRYVCRKAWKSANFDFCTISEPTGAEPCSDPIAWNYAEKQWTKISCTYFGINNVVHDTPCWEGNKPGETTSTGCGYTMKCTDDVRAGKDTDSFCCALKDKKWINCRDEGEDNEVEVPCTTPVLGNTESFNVMLGNYDGTTGHTLKPGQGPQTCVAKCWLQLGLQDHASDSYCFGVVNPESPGVYRLNP